MHNFLTSVFLLLASFSASVHADETPASAQCTPDQARVRASLDHIYHEYLALGKSASVAKLVELDTRLRKLTSDRTPCDGKDDNHLGRSTDTTIGVSVEHYSVTFSYSGKLLAEAHRIDPNSGFRSHTLFSTVWDYSDLTDDWDLPNFNAARAYLREFPKGPFAPDAAMVLAGAYKDAYWGLHLDQSEMEIDSYACVADQLGDLKDKSRSAQETYAKKMAESYFRQAFRLRKPNQEQRYWYDNWRRGHPTYDYCPD